MKSLRLVACQSTIQSMRILKPLISELLNDQSGFGKVLKDLEQALEQIIEDDLDDPRDLKE